MRCTVRSECALSQQIARLADLSHIQRPNLIFSCSGGKRTMPRSICRIINDAQVLLSVFAAIGMLLNRGIRARQLFVVREALHFCSGDWYDRKQGESI